MANLNWFVVYFAAAFHIEFIECREDRVIISEDSSINITYPFCTYEEGFLLCDLNKPAAKDYGLVHLHKGKSTNITIDGATEVELQTACCFERVFIKNSKSIYTKGVSSYDNTYALLLQNSEGGNINDNIVKYIKAEDSTISNLDLQNADEFDIINSTVKTLKASTKTPLRSTIIRSNVNSLSLTTSYLFIDDSEIKKIEKLFFKDEKNQSHIYNSIISEVQPKAITISSGSTVKVESVELGSLAPESIIVHGTLNLINITYSKGYPLDWVVLMKGGTLKISKHLKGNSSIQSYTITEVTSDLRPFEIIDVPKEFWLPIMLGVFLGIALLLICLMCLWFILFSGNKIPVMKFNVQKKMDEQEFLKLEKETNSIPVKNGNKNVYVTGNQEFPTSLNAVEDHSDPESQQEYVDIDPNDQVNYSEVDEKILNNSVVKITMDEKAPNNEKSDNPIIPPRVPLSLPPLKKPKPAVPKREWPPPSVGAKQPNKSFLQNINPKLIAAPPPPSKTVSAFPSTMPTLPPITKQSDDSAEPYESQEEYDVCEDDSN